MNIFYRYCNKELDSSQYRDKRPSWFSKFTCFDTFWNSYLQVRSNGIKLFFIGEPGKLQDYIKSKVNVADYIDINEDTCTKSVIKAIEVIDSVKDNNSIFCAEDDYLWLPDAVETLYYGMELNGFVTGYDHPGINYIENCNMCQNNITKEKEKIVFYRGKHWRTNESTTHTFGCKREIFDKTKHIILNRIELDDQAFFKKSYLDYGIRLWSPIPAVTSDCHITYTSPGINWEYFNNLFKEHPNMILTKYENLNLQIL